MTFVAAFLAFGVLEIVWPARPFAETSWRRWVGHLALYLLTTAAFATPLVAAALAQADGARGLLDELPGPPWLAVAVGVICLDLTSYWSHRLQHAVAPLWRLHAVHHSDPELDVTTTLRQHPLAVLLETAVIAAVVVTLGVPALAVAIFRLADTSVQLLAHANIRLPTMTSRVLVTPAFHRVHHSPIEAETNANYGQVLSVWDHVFGTARTSVVGPERFGLGQFDAARDQDLDRLLTQPFAARR